MNLPSITSKRPLFRHKNHDTGSIDILNSTSLYSL